MSSLADTFLLDSVHQLLHLPEALERLTRGGAAAANGHGGERRGQEAVEKGWGTVPVDIMETAKGYTFILDVPGLSKSDIQVTVEDDNVLVVKGGGGGGKKRKQEEREEEGCRYVRLERKAFPKFVRKFRLPEDSNLDAITARCENGELTVVVEKLPPPPEAKPKTVEVKIG